MNRSTEPVLFDPSDPELRRDPYPTYRRMREEAPTWRSPEGVWHFSRYADCFALFRTPPVSYDLVNSLKAQQRLSSDPAVRQRQIEESERNKSLLDTDPPDHTRLRSLISRAFTAPTVEASRPSIVRLADELIDAFEPDSVELVSQFGVMLPILVICDMLGVPVEERAEFVSIGHAIARTVDPDVTVEERLAALQRQREYIGSLIERRRRDPGDDLITRLIEAAEDGRLATEDELLMNTATLLVAGFETTTNLITNAVYQLLRHPEQLAELCADPTLIRAAIDEVLRFDPPVQLTRPRSVIEETEIGGVQLRPGDAVVPMIAAANRDPDEFDDPERFDIKRRVNRHLTFGLGIHLCVGAALARMEAQIAVSRLFERVPEIALSDEEAEFRPNLLLRGFSKLVLTR